VLLHDVTDTKKTDRTRDKAGQKTEIDKEVKCRRARYPAAYIYEDFLSPPLPRDVCHWKQIWRHASIRSSVKRTKTNFTYKIAVIDVLNTESI
jgi:hypothetical protein